MMTSEISLKQPDWPHAPPHRMLQPGTYMITGATYKKIHYFKQENHLSLLQTTLLDLLPQYAWEIQAWAIFPNHYHFIASNKDIPSNLKTMISHFHAVTAKKINQHDNMTDRQIWFQFWDTFLSYPASYFSRLKYVHQNAVHHKIVERAEEYPWCSASWFQNQAPPSFQKTVNRFKTDLLNIQDEF
jgi:putative transposase